jgi:hypothetical protein
MKKLLSIVTILAASVAAQNLTPAQREADFRYLTSLFSTYYAPIDWKKQLIGFDGLDIKPWLDRVAATKTDLDFYEVCVDYVAGFADTHDHFSLTSDFVARLGFVVDIYEGALLIDSINRTTLPPTAYPFAIGDELISIDGVDAQRVLDGLVRYNSAGNPRAARRQAAGFLTTRPQSRLPHAVDAGVNATVVIRRQSGTSETYTMPWVKTGTPVTVGPVASPSSTAKMARALARPQASAPDYMAPLNELSWSGIISPEQTGLNGYGARNPIFLAGLPATFTRRLGGGTADFFYSGTFKWFELTIGYIRIPNYAPASTVTALQQFDREIAFMNANTDGLIVDEMRNTGGLLCFGENIAQRLIPYPFHATGFEIRPFWARVLSFYNSLVNAKGAGASWDVIQHFELVYNEMLNANQQGRTLTIPLPLCSSNLDVQPAKDADGNVIAYQKPIMMLIDEFSTSTADSVAGMMQDSGRATLFGMRTNGAGGNNTTFDAGVYSEGITGMTLALQSRKDPVGTADYPTSRYIENVGVHPNIVVDYMTKENLLQNGAPFIDRFMQGMAAYVRSQK